MPVKKEAPRRKMGLMRSAAMGFAILLIALVILAAAAATFLSTERAGEGSAPAMAILICLPSAALGGWTAAGLHGARRLPAGLITGGAAAAAILAVTLMTWGEKTSLSLALECAAAMAAGGVLGGCLRAPRKKRRRGLPKSR